jgi:hypothetical protein
MYKNHYTNFNNYCKQQGFIVTDVPADGHCFLYAVVHAMYGNLHNYNQLLTELTNELFDHIHEYSEYTNDLSYNDLSQASQQYAYNKRWDQQIVDLIPVIVSKIIKHRIIIYKIMNQNRFTESLISFDSSYNKQIHLVLYNEHYNSIRNITQSNQDNIITTTNPVKRNSNYTNELNPKRNNRTIVEKSMNKCWNAFFEDESEKIVLGFLTLKKMTLLFVKINI